MKSNGTLNGPGMHFHLLSEQPKVKISYPKPLAYMCTTLYSLVERLNPSATPHFLYGHRGSLTMYLVRKLMTFSFPSIFGSLIRSKPLQLDLILPIRAKPKLSNLKSNYFSSILNDVALKYERFLTSISNSALP